MAASWSPSCARACPYTSRAHAALGHAGVRVALVDLEHLVELRDRIVEASGLVVHDGEREPGGDVVRVLPDRGLGAPDLLGHDRRHLGRPLVEPVEQPERDRREHEDDRADPQEPAQHLVGTLGRSHGALHVRFEIRLRHLFHHLSARAREHAGVHGVHLIPSFAPHPGSLPSAGGVEVR